MISYDKAAGPVEEPAEVFELDATSAEELGALA